MVWVAWLALGVMLIVSVLGGLGLIWLVRNNVYTWKQIKELIKNKNKKK